MDEKPVILPEEPWHPDGLRPRKLWILSLDGETGECFLVVLWTWLPFPKFLGRFLEISHSIWKPPKYGRHIEDCKYR